MAHQVRASAVFHSETKGGKRRMLYDDDYFTLGKGDVTSVSVVYGKLELDLEIILSVISNFWSLGEMKKNALIFSFVCC